MYFLELKLRRKQAGVYERKMKKERKKMIKFLFSRDFWHNMLEYKKYQKAEKQSKFELKEWDDDDWDFDDLLEDFDEVAPGLYTYKRKSEEEENYIQLQIDARAYLADAAQTALQNAMKNIPPSTLASLGRIEMSLEFNCDDGCYDED